MTDFYPRAINILYPAGGINAASFMLNAIGYWKISAVVLFLIPAIAIHWEYAPKKKRR
ncbi:MAG: hypothetical protein LBT92_00075 [Rickettsiales bacterium]|jgi:hypothetical protein|nr:hypothetical protein [Rickettsiales bacterium]